MFIEGGTEIDNWTLDELKSVVQEFKNNIQYDGLTPVRSDVTQPDQGFDSFSKAEVEDSKREEQDK